MSRGSEKGSVRNWAPNRGSNDSPVPLDPKQFDQLYAAERSRCERHDRSLAMLVVETVDEDAQSLEQILEILAQQITPPDTLGRIDRRRAGVLMPETNPAAARQPATDHVAALARAGLRANCVLYADARVATSSTEGPHSLNGAADSKDTGAHPKASLRPAGSIRRGGQIDDFSELRNGPGSGWMRDIALLDLKPLPAWKRVLDVVISALALILLTPLFAVVVLAIRLTSRGPVLFHQKRVGLGGRVFEFYKFRTMYIDAERRREELDAVNEQTGPIFKIRKDPRITPLGRILRKSSIDELPQLWNVLRGDMTLVGPRPPILAEVEEYERWQLARLNIPGGLTCTWQVNGRSEIDFTDWVRMDIRYSRDRSWHKDLRILVKTLRAVITGRGAY